MSSDLRPPGKAKPAPTVMRRTPIPRCRRERMKRRQSAGDAFLPINLPDANVCRRFAAHSPNACADQRVFALQRMLQREFSLSACNLIARLNVTAYDAGVFDIGVVMTIMDHSHGTAAHDPHEGRGMAWLVMITVSLSLWAGVILLATRFL